MSETLKKKELTPQLLKEFQEGNFSHLYDTRLTINEITDLLLKSPDTLERVKVDILKTMIRKKPYLSSEFSTGEENLSDDERIALNRERNDKVRAKLKIAFENADKEKLQQQGLDKRYKYNNYYRTQAGGKSLDDRKTFEVSEEIMLINKEKKREYLIECIETLLSSTISDPTSMHQLFIRQV
ncbi:MAG: hypothetical protein LBO09_02620 [Candidatus Peribacteria bacterium]|jgi:hypothetical protein|nr:hypothetical protein [Candidatus Peribacteria bacterium]